MNGAYGRISGGYGRAAHQGYSGYGPEDAHRMPTDAEAYAAGMKRPSEWYNPMTYGPYVGRFKAIMKAEAAGNKQPDIVHQGTREQEKKGTTQWVDPKGGGGGGGFASNLLSQLPAVEDIFGTSANQQEMAVSAAAAETQAVAGETTKLIAAAVVVGVLGIGAVAVIRSRRRRR